MRIQVQVFAALDQLVARLTRRRDAYAEASLQVMEQVAEYLYDKVYASVSGARLKVRSGRLRASIRREVSTYGSGVTARVFSEGVPYSRIQERGGQTPPHVIAAKRAQALRFEYLGGFMYRRSVQHPGARIPESMYVRSVLIRERTNVRRMIRDGMRLRQMG